MYQVTFFELLMLSEGRRIMALIADGVTPAEEKRLNEIAAELAS